MKTSSNGNIFRVTGPLCGEFIGPGEFPTQRTVTRSFDVFFDLRLNKRLSKQPWGWWFEMPSWSLWRPCNDTFTMVSFRDRSPHNCLLHSKNIFCAYTETENAGISVPTDKASAGILLNRNLYIFLPIVSGYSFGDKITSFKMVDEFKRNSTASRFLAWYAEWARIANWKSIVLDVTLSPTYVVQLVVGNWMWSTADNLPLCKTHRGIEFCHHHYPSRQSYTRHNVQIIKSNTIIGSYIGDRWIPLIKGPVARKMFQFDDVIMVGSNHPHEWKWSAFHTKPLAWLLMCC